MNNDLVNFGNIFKRSFLDLGSFGEVSFVGILVTLFIALTLGMFIYLVYSKTYKGVVYSHNFNTSLVLMSLITAVIIMTVSSNIVLSLGMVGALSIVRFRTAIKDPMDIVFLFWTISVGIATGAKLYSIAVTGSLFIGVTLFLLSKLRYRHRTYLLVVNYDEEAHGQVKGIIDKLTYVLKSKTVTRGKTELTLEMRLTSDNTSFVNQLSMTEGVHNSVLVEYNGDYAE